MNTPPLNRRRKTKNPCGLCRLHQSLCICALIPSLTLKTKLTLVVHTKELRRTTNTGRLAIEALRNSEMRVRGVGRGALDLSDLLTPEYRSFVFYPAPDAVELTQELVAKSPLPIHLIVPDGNWRQASKVHYRHQELENVPRVMLKTLNTSKFHLRAESSEVGMATLQAIAHALGVIEGEVVMEQMMALYNAKLARTLVGRGLLKI